MFIARQRGRGTFVGLHEAITILQGIPGNPYARLLTNNEILLTLPEVTDLARIDRYGVETRCKSGEIAGAVWHGGKTGWRIPRDSVIIYLASNIRGTNK